MIKRLACFLIALATTATATTRPADIPFRIHMIDGGASETAAVADIDKDGRLDIISGEYWYEAPGWARHKFRDLNYTNNYIDDFSDLPVDVNGDGYPDIASVSWFAKKVAWWKNPGRNQNSPWQEAEIHAGFNIEFAILADVDNDGKAHEIVAQENGTPQAWYEVKNGGWVAHAISDRSYGHGIGAGDVNRDGRTDILTPRGWLEAPPDPRAGNWTFHDDWEALNVPDQPQGQPAPSQTPGTPPRILELGFIHAADVNGDGRTDVIAAAGHNYGVFWFEHTAEGPWIRRTIDNAWSQGHASTLADVNGDGRPDFVTGKRFMAHNGGDPGEREPLGVYWYEAIPASPPAGQTRTGTAAGRIEWVRHIIDYGGRMGGGMQIPAVDIDGDGDLDLVCAGKSGLFLVENGRGSRGFRGAPDAGRTPGRGTRSGR